MPGFIQLAQAAANFISSAPSLTVAQAGARSSALAQRPHAVIPEVDLSLNGGHDSRILDDYALVTGLVDSSVRYRAQGRTVQAQLQPQTARNRMADLWRRLKTACLHPWTPHPHCSAVKSGMRAVIPGIAGFINNARFITNAEADKRGRTLASAVSGPGTLYGHPAGWAQGVNDAHWSIEQVQTAVKARTAGYAAHSQDSLRRARTYLASLKRDVAALCSGA